MKTTWITLTTKKDRIGETLRNADFHSFEDAHIVYVSPEEDDTGWVYVTVELTRKP